MIAYVLRYWKDPNTFDPYRFYDPATKSLIQPNVIPGAWEPFGRMLHRIVVATSYYLS